LIQTFEKKDCDLIKYIVDMMEYRKRLKDIQKEVFDRLNKKEVI